MKTRRGVTRDLIGAIYPYLNVAGLLAVSTNGVYHAQAPQGTLPPYTVIQAPSSVADLWAMQSVGERVSFQIKAVTGQPDYAEALQILELAKQVLDGEQPTIANHVVLRLWWEWTRTFPDPDLVNGVALFSAVSQWCALVDQVS